MAGRDNGWPARLALQREQDLADLERSRAKSLGEEKTALEESEPLPMS